MPLILIAVGFAIGLVTNLYSEFEASLEDMSKADDNRYKRMQDICATGNVMVEGIYYDEVGKEYYADKRELPLANLRVLENKVSYLEGEMWGISQKVAGRPILVTEEVYKTVKACLAV